MTDSVVKRLNVLVLCSYNRMGASSRIRMYQFESALSALGVSCTFAPLLGDEHLARRYAGKGVSAWLTLTSYLQRVKRLLNTSEFDVIWLEKELFQWVPYSVESLLLGSRTPFVVEYDDAVFHRYDQHRIQFVRLLYGQKIDRLMARANHVIAGNEYIAQHARSSGAARCDVIPTVIDMQRYDPVSPVKEDDGVLRVGWIGSPVTVQYLDVIREPLERLGKDYNVELCVVGGESPDIPGVRVRNIKWSSDKEVESIYQFDLGVMPLPDAEWERGKCGYKLIQYMGCGLPVVASPVGVNQSIVREGVNGYLATTSDEWYTALSALAADTPKRQAMGKVGRKIATEEYSLQAVVSGLADILRGAAR